METVTFDPTIKFADPSGEGFTGTLSWESGVFRFEGNAEESARIFFDALKMRIDEYIETTKSKPQ